MANSEVLEEIDKLESIKGELIKQLNLEDTEESIEAGEQEIAKLNNEIEELKESLAENTTPAMMVTEPLDEKEEAEEETQPEEEVPEEELVVKFIQPRNNQNFASGNDIGVEIEATSSSGEISKLELYANDTFVRKEGLKPYEWGTVNSNSAKDDANIFNSLAPGKHTLKVVVTSTSGLETTEEISIVMESAAEPAAEEAAEQVEEENVVGEAAVEEENPSPEEPVTAAEQVEEENVEEEEEEEEEESSSSEEPVAAEETVTDDPAEAAKKAAEAVQNTMDKVSDSVSDIGNKIGGWFSKKRRREAAQAAQAAPSEEPEESIGSSIGAGVTEALTPGEDGEIDPMAGAAVNTAGSVALGALKAKIDEIKGWSPKELMPPIHKGMSVNFVFITGNLDFRASLEADWTVTTVKPMSGPIESWGAEVGAGLIGKGSITASVGGGLSLGPFDLFKLTFGIFGQITVFGGPKVTLTMDAATNKLLGASGSLAIEVSCQAGPAIGFHCDILPKKHLYEAVEKANDKFFSGKFEPYQNELRLTALDKKILIVTLGSVSVTVDTAKGFSFSMNVSGPSIKLHPALKSMIDGWIQKVKDGIRSLLDFLSQAWNAVKETYVDAGWEYSAWGGGMF